MVDGVKQPVYDGLGGDIMFSPDSRHISYIGIRRNRHFVVIDGSENGPYDGTAGGTVFSRHGARVAYVASTNRKWMVLIDGQASSRHDDVTGLALSGEGRRMAYVARDGGKERFVLDGSPGDPWDRIYLPTGGTFSPDGSRWLYVARNGNKVRTVIDGEPGNPYDDIAPTIAWVEGERVAYLAEDREQKGFVCVLDGVESNVYDIIVVWGDLSSNLVPPQEGVVDQPLNYLRYLAIRRGAVLTVREEVTLAQAY